MRVCVCGGGYTSSNPKKSEQTESWETLSCKRRFWDMFWEASLKNARKRWKKIFCPFMLQFTTSRSCISWAIITQLLKMIVTHSAVEHLFLFSLVTMLVTPESLTEKQIASTNLGWQKQRILYTVEHFIINNVSLLRSPPDEMSLHKQNTSTTLCEDQYIQVFSCVQHYMFTMPEELKKIILHTDSEMLVWTIGWLYTKICEFHETPQETHSWIWFT